MRCFFSAVTAIITCFFVAKPHLLIGVIALLWGLRVLATRDKKIILLVTVTAVVFLGVGWQEKRTAQSQTPREVQKCQGTIRVYADGVKVNGDLATFTGVWLEKKQKVQLYLYLKQKSQQLALKKLAKGGRYAFTGQVQAFSPPTNENQFDYQFFMRSKQTYLSLRADKLRRVGDLKERGLTLATIHAWRQKSALALQKLPQPLSSFAQLLLIGSSEVEFQTTLNQIKKLGLLYLFCLSGMHVFYVVGFLRTLAKFFRLKPGLENLLLVVMLPFYALLAGASTSLLRAVGMVWFRSLSQLGSRKLSRLEAWSLVGLLTCLWRPLSVFNLGAQMSYLLTLLLIVVPDKVAWRQNLMLNLFSIPLLLYSSYQYSLWTILLSWLFGPLFTYGILPTVLLGTFLQPIRSFSNRLLWALCQLFARLDQHAGLVTYGKPALISVCLVLFMLLLLKVHPHKHYYRWCILLVVSLNFMWLHYPWHGEIVYFDIGQGDCTLIRTARNRQVILVDTGGKVSFQKETWQTRQSKTNGQTVVANYLLSKGINHIDDLILTHQDTDHVGNFPSISQEIKVKQVWIPAGMEQSSSFQRRLVASRIQPTQVKGITTTQHHSGWPANLSLLHPFQPGKGSNEDSIAFIYRYYGINCWFSGDLDRNGEKQILQQHPTLRAQILKTGHHGSKTATDPSLVAALQPKLAVISAGRNNRYGHPNQETLATLKNYGVPYLNTAHSGMISLRIVKGRPQVSTYIK
ncbi:DNA internalization-related competence protein ComEC/Rec2 [Ligilactobacillus equi]